MRTLRHLRDRAPHRRLRPSLAAAVLVLAAGCGGVRHRLGRQFDWVQENPSAPADVKKAVLGKKLIRGMSEGAVVASWGEPDRKLDLGAGDARWTYRRGQILNRKRVTISYTLVFNRGVLVSWIQDSRR